MTAQEAKDARGAYWVCSPYPAGCSHVFNTSFVGYGASYASGQTVSYVGWYPEGGRIYYVSR